jgi:hypothetical protein
MRTLGALLLGIAGAAVLCGIAWLLPAERGLDLLAVGLAVVGAVYLGSALNDGRLRLQLLEGGVAVFFLVLALVGLWYAPLVLAAGWLLHAVWDYFHHPHPLGAPVAAHWYPLACLSFDVLVAAFLVVQYS